MTVVIDSLMERAERTLHSVWGYETFRPLQREAVSAALAGRDSLVVLPTGGGKSLCFQVPALCRDGLAVVVSPLISLMKDQVDSLVSNGVSAAFINSTQRSDQQREIANRIRAGELKLLYVAPERLLTDRMLDFLSTVPLSMVAIDEAHCISDWGHDFRPEYRGLRQLKERFAVVPVHAYTATASANVRQDIIRQLGLSDPEILVGSFDRPNLTYRMLNTKNRLEKISEVIGRHRNESGIIYCISRKEVERLVGILTQNGLKAVAYHAGMDDHMRQKNQDAFIHDAVDIVVATVAFGMGIDKPDVRYVIHANMPKSVEHYQQESGRAGRDGLESECVLLYSAGDLLTWQRMTSEQDSATRESSNRLLDAIYKLCANATCRHRSLSAYFGQDLPSDNCGACDICLNEIDQVEDPITLGQKILSCVLRLGERFGADYTAKVLIGSSDQRITQLRHDQLSTYGLLRDEKLNTVRQWIEQLVSQGFLVRTGEYQTLGVSATGKQLLKRELAPTLTLPPATSRSKDKVAAEFSWEGVDRGLFDYLKQLRSRLAVARNVPAYIIFGDTTLRELARIRPSNLEKLRLVRGIGDQKLQDFGADFLEALDEYCGKEGLVRDEFTPVTSSATPESVIKLVPGMGSGALTALEYFQRGLTVEQVAKKMDRAVSTAWGYLFEYIQHEKVTDPSRWVSAADAAIIEPVIAANTDGRLRTIFDALEGKYDFNSLRVVSACRSNRLRVAE